MNTNEIRVYPAPGCSGTKARRRTQPFIKGPVPITWLQAAAQSSTNALPVGIALWHRQGMARGKPIVAGLEDIALFGQSRDTVRRGIHALERAKLIEVTRQPGCKARITIINTDDVSVASPGTNTQASRDAEGETSWTK